MVCVSLCVRVRVCATVLFHKRSYGFHNRRLFLKWAPFMLYSVGSRINQAYEMKRGTQEPYFLSSHSRFFVITQVLKLKSASFCFSVKPCVAEKQCWSGVFASQEVNYSPPHSGFAAAEDIKSSFIWWLTRSTGLSTQSRGLCLSLECYRSSSNQSPGSLYFMLLDK